MATGPGAERCSPEECERGGATRLAPGVLIADDDPLVLSLVRTVLEHRGFAVWTAESGLAALEQYARHRERINVVLLDVRLGEIDGPQTLMELRRLYPAVACFFMTAHSGDYSADDLIALGAVDTFEKPFQLDVLAERLWQTANGCVRSEK